MTFALASLAALALPLVLHPAPAEPGRRVRAAARRPQARVGPPRVGGHRKPQKAGAGREERIGDWKHVLALLLTYLVCGCPTACG